MSTSEDEEVEEPREEIWRDAERTRWFLIPSDQSLPEGELELRHRLKGRVNVDPRAAAGYEISAEQASARVDAQVGDALGKAAAAFRGLFKDEDDEAPAEEAEPFDPSFLFGGVTPGQMYTDPDKAREGARALLGFLGNEARRRSQVDPDRVRERLETIEGSAAESIQTLAEEVLPRVGGALEKVAEVLHETAEDLQNPPDGESDAPADEPV